MNTVTKVLEVSPWEESVSSSIYPDAEITRCDWAAPVPPEYNGKFDAIMANSILQRFNYMAAPSVVARWVDCLREGGELHIVVPSLEWACRQVLSENPSPVCQVVLWGGQGGDGSVHTSGYTMRLLRATLQRCGLNATKAKTDKASIEYGGHTYEFEQHYVCGVKGMPELKKS